MTAQPLTGVSVLVTRPEHQSAALIEAIDAAGGQSISFPAIDIQPRSAADIERDRSALGQPDIVIFVSANAVAGGLDSINTSEARIAAIGPATIAAIEGAGGRVDISPEAGFDSEHLLMNDALSDVSGKAITIVRGDSGRELLADTLKKRGATVNYLQVYSLCTHQPSKKALTDLEDRWRNQLISAVMVMSVASLESLLQILPSYCVEQLQKTRLVAPSARVIQTALEHIPGVTAVLSPGPGARDMTDALIANLQVNSDTKNG